MIHGFDAGNLPLEWGVEGTIIAEASAAVPTAESTEQPSPSVVPEPAPSSSPAPTSAPNPLTEEALTSASDSSETLVESTDSAAGTAGSEAPPAPRVRFVSQPEFAYEDLNSMAGEVGSEARSEMPSRPPVNWQGCQVGMGVGMVLVDEEKERVGLKCMNGSFGRRVLEALNYNENMTFMKISSKE